jgi:hypothetical protein
MASLPRPNMTYEEDLMLRLIYTKHRDKWGLNLITYVGETPKSLLDEQEDWERMIKETFGEDDPITEWMLQPRPNFFISGSQNKEV